MKNISAQRIIEEVDISDLRKEANYKVFYPKEHFKEQTKKYLALMAQGKLLKTIK